MLFDGDIVCLGKLFPSYLDNGRVFFCPADLQRNSYRNGRVGPSFRALEDALHLPSDAEVESSYFLRGDLVPDYPSPDYNLAYSPGMQVKSEKSLVKHPDWIILADSGIFWDHSEALDPELIAKRICHPGPDGKPAYFSNGWADGHVTAYRVRDPDMFWPNSAAENNEYLKNARGMVLMENGQW